MRGVVEWSVPTGASEAALEWPASVLSDEEWAVFTARVSELE